MKNKLVPVILGFIILSGICILSQVEYSSANSENTTTKIEELKKENKQLKKENQELKSLLEEQNRILMTLAKLKKFTQEAWESLVVNIRDLNKKVDEKIKEIGKDKKENR